MSSVDNLYDFVANELKRIPYIGGHSVDEVRHFNSAPATVQERIQLHIPSYDTAAAILYELGRTRLLQSPNIQITLIPVQPGESVLNNVALGDEDSGVLQIDAIDRQGRSAPKTFDRAALDDLKGVFRLLALGDDELSALDLMGTVSEGYRDSPHAYPLGFATMRSKDNPIRLEMFKLCAKGTAAAAGNPWGGEALRMRVYGLTRAGLLAHFRRHAILSIEEAKNWKAGT